MTARLEGKCAIVTGAAQGLGRAFSVGLASEGASVVLADMNLVGAEEGASLIQEAGGQAISVHVDGSNPAHTQIMAKTALAAYHRIDILVNNAGIYPIKPWDHITLEEWNHVLAVNLTGPFLCAQAVFPTMQAQGYGKIINISSGAFFAGLPNFLHYVSSKAGLIGFTRALAREVGDHGIRVNAITIGLTQTEGVKSLVTQGVFPEEAGDQMAAQQCIKRREQPEDALGAVIFLASPESDFITGQTINVDGGWAMH
jgi:3-oxoacyl-[acyl-carrier protein] reductase